MRGNIIQFETPAPAPDQVEPVEAAVLEVSARVATLNEVRRCLYTRLDELRGPSPPLCRRCPRAAPPAPSRAVTFYSIEEAAAEDAASPLQVA